MRAAVVLDDPAALPAIARTLSEQGHYRWRAEAFDVRATPDGPALAQIDRGAHSRPSACCRSACT